MQVILYSMPNCPQCKALKDRLICGNYHFQVIDDIELMLSKGFTHVPMVEINNKIMNYAETIKWMDEGETKN